MGIAYRLAGRIFLMNVTDSEESSFTLSIVPSGILLLQRCKTSNRNLLPQIALQFVKIVLLNLDSFI